MKPLNWIETTPEREIEKLTLQLNTLQSRFEIIMAFMMKQFPLYFAADHDMRAVDPTLNPIALPITQEEADATNAALKEMQVEFNPDWKPNRHMSEDYTQVAQDTRPTENGNTFSGAV